ncbi:MAG: CARDB domain-containing protein, partial [Planctomycetota bacterium]
MHTGIQAGGCGLLSWSWAQSDRLRSNMLALVLAGACLAGAASAAGLPNLTPTTPNGWSSPLVVAILPGQTVDSSTLPPFPNDRPLYVSMALTNSGNAAAGAFVVELLVDGTVVQTVNVVGLNAGSNFTVIGLQVNQISAVGDHTFQMIINPTHTVIESNPNDNVYQRTVPISSSLPNLTYATPGGWSGPLVVTTSAGSTQDSTSTPPYPTDAVLYAEMGIINNGTKAAGAFDLVLQVDGVEVQRYHVPGLAAGSEFTETDVNLGSLARGTHSLSMLIDPGNTVVESNENDNSFIRTIQVLYPVPTFTCGTISFATAGSYWTFQIMAAPNITSYNAGAQQAGTPLPDWMYINTGTGLISGTPGLTTSGAGPNKTTANIIIAASNADFTNSQPLNITIYPAPPVITSLLQISTRIGQDVNYAVLQGGSDANITFVPTGIAGLKATTGVGSGAATITGTPTQAGSFFFTITATNTGINKQTDVKLLEIDVAGPPLFTSQLTGISGAVGQNFSYQIQTSPLSIYFDRDVSPGPPVVDSLPPGLSINNYSGLISGTPSPAAVQSGGGAGTYTVPLYATTTGGSGNATLTIGIQDGVKPAITSPLTVYGFDGAQPVLPGLGLPDY